MTLRSQLQALKNGSSATSTLLAELVSCVGAVLGKDERAESSSWFTSRCQQPHRNAVPYSPAHGGMRASPCSALPKETSEAQGLIGDLTLVGQTGQLLPWLFTLVVQERTGKQDSNLAYRNEPLKAAE